MEMDRRSELRFQIYTSARIALFDEPEREMEVQMVDLSPSGLRFITDEEFQEDQIVTIETAQHLILADIRNCNPRGIRFAVGAERVHSAAKFILPRCATKAERNQELVADYHRRLHGELEKPAMPRPPRTGGAIAHFALDADTRKVETEPAPPQPGGSEPSAPVVSESKPVVTPAPAWKQRTTILVTLSVVAALLLFLPKLFGHREAVAPGAARIKASAAPVLVVDSAVPPAAASPSGTSVVSVAANGRSWITVCADDRMVFSKMFTAGSQGDVEFANRAVVRVGSAGHTDISLNGKPVGLLGQAGQVRVLELTPESSRVLAEGESGGCLASQ
jgi:hypothetical protein